jgi:hypothetical protein
MLETSRVTAQLEAARAFADKVGLRPQLETRLSYLERYAAPKRTRCMLAPDPAPYSFSFVMELDRGAGWTHWFDGGLLYHAPHDGHGSGSMPTLSVTVSPTMGWAVHT